MSPWRWAVVVVLLGSLAGVTAWALGRDGPEDAVAADPPATEASPSPEATPEPSPSPEPTPTEVLPANDVQDPLEAIVAIEAYRDWLFENPDPEKVGLIYHEACECYEGLQDLLQAAVEARTYLELEPTRVTSLSVLQQDTDRSVIVAYETYFGGGVERAADGSSVAERAAEEEPQTWRVNLLLGTDGRWRVIARTRTDS
jgi:hypothetical protein